MIETQEANRLDGAELKSIQAEASSANARINIPLNLEKYKHLTADHQADVVWFHQHALDEKMTLKDCASALGYDSSTTSRILNGIYEGSWKNICSAIQGYKRIVADRIGIQKNEFVENSMTRLIFAGLDYAMANNSITVITGESRFGKTVTAKVWRDRNNHGRSAFITAPAYGGTKALLRDIAICIGVNKNLSIPQMHDAVLRGFNKNRILIVDEAHRLLPGDRRTNPVNLEILRDLHDHRAGSGLEHARLRIPILRRDPQQHSTFHPLEIQSRARTNAGEQKEEKFQRIKLTHSRWRQR